MRYFYGLILSFLGIALASDVIELSDSNFRGNVDGQDIILVEFFAPWCGHCKRLAPEYEIAATALKRNDPPVPLAKVDCTEAGKDTCSKYGVSGYPTLKVFRKGTPSDYEGPRESAGIISYMKSISGPSSVEVSTQEKMDKKLESSDNVIFGFFSSENDWYKTFLKVADQKRSDYSFAHTTSTALLEKYGVEDGIVLFRAAQFHNIFEDKQKQFDGANDASAIKRWIKENFHGMCGHRTQSNMAQFSEPLVTAYFNVDYVRDRKGTNYWRNRVMKVAKPLVEAKARVSFAISSLSEFNAELSDMGRGDYSGKLPLVVARRNGRKFIMDKDFSVATLKDFVQDFLDEKLEPFIKSEPVPTEQGNVKVVVGKNFDEIVNDEERDVLIEFYAPWCGHCKSLEPKYTELGDKLAKETGITIAKMDATANDVPPPYQVQGFPTIYFAPKGNKSSPKKYEGAREVKDFIKYLARESTDGLQTVDRDGKKKKKTDEL